MQSGLVKSCDNQTENGHFDIQTTAATPHRNTLLKRRITDPYNIIQTATD